MTKGYVTDKNIGKEIHRVSQTGNAWTNLKNAAEVVCQRLSSRDDHKTVAAFRIVLGSFEPLDKTAFDYIYSDGAGNEEK